MACAMITLWSAGDTTYTGSSGTAPCTRRPRNPRSSLELFEIRRPPPLRATLQTAQMCLTVGGYECATYRQETIGTPPRTSWRARMCMGTKMTTQTLGPSALKTQSRVGYVAVRYRRLHELARGHERRGEWRNVQQRASSNSRELVERGTSRVEVEQPGKGPGSFDYTGRLGRGFWRRALHWEQLRRGRLHGDYAGRR